jgi:hypothetical protein
VTFILADSPVIGMLLVWKINCARAAYALDGCMVGDNITIIIHNNIEAVE